MNKKYIVSASKLKIEKIIFSKAGFFSAFFIVLFLSTTDLKAQYFDMINAKVEVVAKGTNTTPIEGDGFSLKSYRVEVARVDQSSNEVIERDKLQERKSIRLVLTGKFPPGVYVIWINGVGNFASNGTKEELYLVFSGGEKKFEENSEIAVSRNGLNEPRVYLPETFEVPKRFQFPKRSKDDLFNNVKLNYVKCGTILISDSPTECISVKINKLPFSVSEGIATNHGWYLQIGDKEFWGNRDYYTIDTKSFRKLKDGEWVVVKAATGIAGGVSVGKLNKGSLLGVH